MDAEYCRLSSVHLNFFRVCQIPGLENNPLVKRVIDVFDVDGNHEVDFKEFITTLSIFSDLKNSQQKLMCMLVSCTVVFQ